MDTTASVKEEQHLQKKRNLAKIIQAKSKNSAEPITLQKETSNLFRHRQAKSNRIDVRQFNQVISVDKENLIAVTEGMTTFEDLVAETLKYNCMPQVVPELKTITIGGALSGIGIESSSFRYGLVHETINEFDVLLPDGKIANCKPDNEHSDLFFAFPNSYGTLGYALKVVVKLVPVKKYVKLSYTHYDDTEKFFKDISQNCEQNRISSDMAFIEGVVFDKKNLVLSTAEFTDEAPYCSNYKYMKIYYKSLKKRDLDYLTTHDYIWRWDPDWFWCSKVFGAQNPVIRFLFGKWLLKSRVYSKIMRFFNKSALAKSFLKKIEKPEESVIQDVCLPSQNSHDFFNFFIENITIRPFWICPIHPSNPDHRYTFFKMNPSQLYLNFGFWGSVPSSFAKGHFNRLVERKVEELGGNKSLYSNVFYSREEFWSIYDEDQYRTLKSKYDPENSLNNLYSKCTEKNN